MAKDNETFLLVQPLLLPLAIVGFWVLCCFYGPVCAQENGTVSIKSTYLSPTTGAWGKETIWRFESNQSDTMKVYKGTSAVPALEVALDQNGCPLTVTDKISGVMNITRGMDEHVVLSWGYPIPFDFLDPADQTSKEISIKKRVGSTVFSYAIKREVEVLSPESPIALGLLSQTDVGHSLGAKELLMISLYKEGRLVVRQLWPRNGTWWIFEETPIRKSWRMP